MESKSVHIFYEGGVQGVGFRMTAERAAVSFGLNGWVRNLNDGRVEVLCEGPKEDIELFINKISSVFRRYISNAEVQWIEPSGSNSGFRIRYD